MREDMVWGLLLKNSIMRNKHIIIEEYNKAMNDLMESDEFKALPIEEQLIAMLELADKYKII